MDFLKNMCSACGGGKPSGPSPVVAEEVKLPVDEPVAEPVAADAEDGSASPPEKRRSSRGSVAVNVKAPQQ